MKLTHRDLVKGNYFQYQNEIVKTVDFNSVMTTLQFRDNNEKMVYTNYLKPIPLTEEILLNNCGFRQFDNQFSHPKTVFKIIYQHGTNFLGYSADGIYIAKSLKYLHELQNLFYAINWKGEELEIKF